MSKMTWNNNTQCYEITVTDKGPTYDIHIPNVKNKALLGDIALNVNFKEYKLKDSSSITTFVPCDNIFGDNITYTMKYNRLDINYSVVNSSYTKGMLVDNSGTYTRVFDMGGSTWYEYKVNSVAPLGTTDAYTCKSAPRYMYNYIFFYQFTPVTCGSKTVNIGEGGSVFQRWENGTLYWFYRETKSSPSVRFNSLSAPIIRPSAGHAEDVIEVEIYFY